MVYTYCCIQMCPNTGYTVLYMYIGIAVDRPPNIGYICMVYVHVGIAVHTPMYCCRKTS